MIYKVTRSWPFIIIWFAFLVFFVLSQSLWFLIPYMVMLAAVTLGEFEIGHRGHAFVLNVILIILAVSAIT